MAKSMLMNPSAMPESAASSAARGVQRGTARLDDAGEKARDESGAPRLQGSLVVGHPFRGEPDRQHHEEHVREDARRVDAVRERRDVVAAGACGEAASLPRVEEVPDEQAHCDAREHAMEEEVVREVQDPATEREDQQHLHEVVDNLVQVLLILALCRGVLHFPDDLLFHRMLPGVAVSLLVGNFFYAWQARRLAARTGRHDVTALPYGINTPSIFAYVFLVMLPVWLASEGMPVDQRALQAWRAGLVACLLSGVIETRGAALDATGSAARGALRHRARIHQHGLRHADLPRAARRPRRPRLRARPLH